MKCYSILVTEIWHVCLSLILGTLASTPKSDHAYQTSDLNSVFWVVTVNCLLSCVYVSGHFSF